MYEYNVEFKPELDNMWLWNKYVWMYEEYIERKMGLN